MSVFMDNAAKKVASAKNFLMSNGQRDFMGYLETRNRILQTAQNYENYRQGWEPFKSFANFSEGPGLNAVANTTGIDVVDISILTSVKSFLPYLAVDRGMAKPQDLLTYQVLVASNDAGGLKKGEEAVHPYKPISRNLALSRTDAKTEEVIEAGETSVTVQFPIMKGKTKAVYNGVLGEDIKGDGHIYWQGAGVNVTINYEAGEIALDEAAPAQIQFQIYPDTTSEVTGNNTLKLRPETRNIMLEAEPNRVILETSMEQIAYMNRLLGNGIGTNREFGEVALQQLLNAFIYWINSDLVTTTWQFAKEVVPSPMSFDMSAYYGDSQMTGFAPTKNDKMNQFILELNSDVLTRSGQGVTYYLVGAMGANILANNTDKFVRTEIFGQQLNGVVGTYDGVPVLRHDLMTSWDTAGEANIIAGHKDISGASKPYRGFAPKATLTVKDVA